MHVKLEFIQLLLRKNNLTNFIASVSEAVKGIFLPPPKLRPKKNITMFTNRKGFFLAKEFAILQTQTFMIVSCLPV